MDFGQLLAGAGVVGQAWRKEEEAQRRAYEQEQEAKHLAYLRELQRAELERQERLRKLALQQPLPAFSPSPAVGAGMPVFDTNNPPTAAPTASTKTPTAASATPATPVAPTGVQTFALPPAPGIETRELPKTDINTSGDLAALQAERNKLALERNSIKESLWFPGVPFFERFYSADDHRNLNILRDLDKRIKDLDEQIRAASVPLAREEYNRVNPLYAKEQKARQEYEAGKNQRASQQPQISQTPQTPQTPQPSFDVNRLVQAVVQVESSGNPNAVSGKNAVGLMQVRPETAMNPGFGASDIFIVAERVGEKVNRRTKAEAERLLRNPKVNVEFGTAYLQALLNHYGGNLEYALAAYNAGPTVVNKWIQNGADFTKLPKETRNYIAKITALLNQEETGQSAGVVTPTKTVGLNIPDITAAKTAQAEDTYIDPSKFYLANPQSIPLDMQRALQQREEIVRLAEMYRNAGMGAQYLEARNQLLGLDNNIMLLHGMQGLQEFTLANDPRRLAWVWSQYAGVPVGVQPRTDGKFNIFVNGQKVKEALDSATVAEMARLAFDQTFRATQAAASAETNKLLTQSQLKIAEEIAKQQAQMVHDIYVERARGDIQRALKMLEQAGFDVKPLGDGSGALVVTPRDGRSLPFIFYPDGVKQKVGDQEVIMYYQLLQPPGF